VSPLTHLGNFLSLDKGIFKTRCGRTPIVIERSFSYFVGMQTTITKETNGSRVGAAATSPYFQRTSSFGFNKAAPACDLGVSSPHSEGNGFASRNHKTVFEALVHSKIYQDYERAFSEATGLPISLCPVESWHLPLHGKRKENPFCALIAEKSKGCASCLQVLQTLSESAEMEPQSITCQAGLTDMAVPVRLGDHLIGYLQTGQVFRKKPTSAQFNKAAKLVADWGFEIDRGALEKLYMSGKVISSKEQESVLKLLAIFAQHLSIVSNQIAVHHANAEPPVIVRAKEFIKDHYSEELSLGQVAKSVNVSTFYFCKMFKKITGLNFTDYVSRVRVERAKNLLLNPNLRVSEIAYEVGFQSLTHFNRVFKKILGQSPTQYRSQFPGS